MAKRTKTMTDAADIELEWSIICNRAARETAPANKDPPLVFLAFPVSGECPRTSQGYIESKYLPWYTEFTRVRVLVLIF